MSNITQITLTSGIPTGPSGTVSTLDALMADGGQATLGAKADAKSTATDVTPVSAMSVWKQISASVQALAAGGGGSIVTIADGGAATTGTKADAKAATTDATPISMMSVLKQISFSIQAAAASLIGTLNVAVTNANGNGRALPGNSAPVVLNSQTYTTCAASATTILGTTGATGDYLDGVLIIPGTAAAGIVQLKDGTGAAFTIFAGGGVTALPTLAPFYVAIGAISKGGAGGWQVITNANVTALAIGNGT